MEVCHVLPTYTLQFFIVKGDSHLHFHPLPPRLFLEGEVSPTPASTHYITFMMNVTHAIVHSTPHPSSIPFYPPSIINLSWWRWPITLHIPLSILHPPASPQNTFLVAMVTHTTPLSTFSPPTYNHNLVVNIKSSSILHSQPSTLHHPPTTIFWWRDWGSPFPPPFSLDP